MKTSSKHANVTDFYLIYNSQTAFYDFAGTNLDNIQNYDASFHFANITDTDKAEIAYKWNLIPGTSNYGISLELTGWERILTSLHPKSPSHSGEKEKGIKHEAKKE